MAKSGFIALIGRPNAGKSTLLNWAVGAPLSVISPKAQTTRDQILGILSEEKGQALFIDTPGIHRADPDGLNAYMVDEAKEALESPHLIWYVVDPHSAVKHEETVLEILAKCKSPILLVINKTDCLGKRLRVEIVDEFITSLENRIREMGLELIQTFRVSALKETGLDELLTCTWESLPEGEPYYPDQEQISDKPTRFFVSEIIRGRLLALLGDEVPYSCGVKIDRFDEKTIPLRIEASLFVERDSQKGIVIGQGGKKIKEIGQSAREEIELWLKQKVFLGLQVKVLKDWSKKQETLRQLGYPVRK